MPPGFAHGFLVVSKEAEFVYKCTSYYAPDDEFGIRWDDPELGITWPEDALPPTLSDKDQNAPLLKEARVYS